MFTAKLLMVMGAQTYGGAFPRSTVTKLARAFQRNWWSEFSPNEEMIERDRAAAVHQEVERGHRPHQRVFEAGLVPEISAHAPAFVIRHDQENDDRAGSESGEQSQREHRAGNELRQRDGRCPEFSGTIAIAIELLRQLRQVVRQHARRRKHPERVA